MIIRCGENLYQALSQSDENLYSSSEYIPFDICSLPSPLFPLIRRKNTFISHQRFLCKFLRRIYWIFLHSIKNKGEKNEKKKSAYFQSL